jgi:hypothetical protein
MTCMKRLTNPNNPLTELLAAKQRSLQMRQVEKSANPLTDKLARWQRFNRFVWDKKK